MAGPANGLRSVTKDLREWVLTGIVEARDGYMLTVRLTDGREVEARAVHPSPGTGRGLFWLVTVGTEVEVSFDHGQTSGAMARPSPASPAQDLPSDVDSDDVLYLYDNHVEVRSAEGQGVDGIVLRSLLDDLVDVTTDLAAVMVALTSPDSPPGTAVQNAALLTEMRTAGATIVTKLATLNTRLNTSRAGQGVAPYCSPVLRATDGT